MEISIDRHGEDVILYVTGKIDTVTAPELKKKIDEIIQEKNVVLDFKNVKYLSSLGIRVILSAYKELQNIGGSIKLTNVCEIVYEVLEMTGFTDVITVN